MGQLYHGCGQDRSVTDDATHVTAWYREKGQDSPSGWCSRKGPAISLNPGGREVVLCAASGLSTQINK